MKREDEAEPGEDWREDAREVKEKEEEEEEEMKKKKKNEDGNGEK
jgi:hypothetical protein